MKKLSIPSLFFCLIISQANGQTNNFPSTGNAKIFAVGESWAEGLSIVRSSGWSGVRFTRNDPTTGNYNGNWATGYYGNSNDFSFSTYYSGTQYDGILHLSNSNRNVGIGTTSPEGKFTISETGNGWNDGLRVNRDASNYLTLTEDVTDIRLKNWGAGGLLFFTSSVQAATILNNGNMGIGTPSPSAKLHINGNGAGSVDLLVNGRITTGDAANAGGMFVNGAATMFVGQANSALMGMYNNGSWRMVVDNTGKVGIGTLTPDYPLTVNGSIHAKEVRVDLSVPGPDYVFEKEYKLTSLDDIKNYIDQNKHLPEVPSAKEMEKNGVQLGEMNMILLKKIEELTLHVIELKKENEAAKVQMIEMVKENEKQNKMINLLRSQK